MKKILPRSVMTGAGVAVGTLIYTGYFGIDHEFGWGRAVFIGVLCGIVAAVWPQRKE